MTAIRLFSAGLILCASALAATAETKVELKGTHLCCGQCVRAVGEILKKVDGVTGTCDQKGGIVKITAKDDASWTFDTREEPVTMSQPADCWDHLDEDATF